MQLSVRDRLLVAGLLPTQNNFVTMKMIRDLSNDLGFSAEEIETFGIKTVVSVETGTSQTQWNDSSATKDIKFSAAAFTLVRKTLEALDKEYKITAETMDLYERFVLADNAVEVSEP